MAIIVRLPLASGLLGGKLAKETRFPKEDHRTYNRDGQFFNVGETFAGLPYENAVELVDSLKPMVPPSFTMAQMAQRWILDFDAVTVVIAGASRATQVNENVSVSGLPPLGTDLHAKLKTFYEHQVARYIRGPY